MPKRIPESEKRVPLNCLVPPATMAVIKALAVGGYSQGDVVANGIAALQVEQSQFAICLDIMVSECLNWSL